jgi:polyhydroxyalkanoate synthase subunit PhaC
MTTTVKDTATSVDAADHAAPLDTLLVDGALRSLRRWSPGIAGLRLAMSLAIRPTLVSRQVRDLVIELGRVGAGSSQLQPGRKDRRFSAPAWNTNPVLRRAVQAYLATGGTLASLVDGADLDWRSGQRMRFLVDNLVSAAAPSNSPLLNPEVLKTTVETRGRNFAAGALNLVKDMASPPRVPSMVDPSRFEVGENLGLTPGAVIFRSEVFELIQYASQTTKVRKFPLVVSPPTINKFYITDLAPGRSMVEHFVKSGQQVFMISWRNPDARHAGWGLDTYIAAVLTALDTAHRICHVDRAVLLGICAGGIISALAASHLAATGRQHQLAGLALAVTVLDQDRAGVAGALMDRRRARAATAISTRKGYLDGRRLAELFAWLRPDDLVWNYWVNNYLLGRPPPAFDVLYWNSDTTRMAAAQHRDFVDLALGNKLVTPGQAIALGTPVDLSKVDVDAYVIAGIADHITPWQNCYRTTQLLGGDTKFVLSTSGHIAALVNPPGNDRASFQVADDTPEDTTEWLARASTVKGSWWPDFVAWLAKHSGPEKSSPRRLGGPGLKPLVDAPGKYVLDR